MGTDSQAGGKHRAKKGNPEIQEVLMKLHILCIEIAFVHVIASKNSRAAFWVVQIMLETKMDQP